ncbi:ATP-binding protein [Rhizomonospora bruguierae]|uniref:ATP-binding protein n=1 Tax=Rhizomonospora bruguierae TaxID=1581705 RepID=UPI0020C02659|nr:ATP-binding protein [Micromonospora sp. NBRC 107566]
MTGRGRLRVLLGAAPGVGKTYAMLEEGKRLLDEGKDVVVAVVATRGRSATAAAAQVIPALPGRTVCHPDATFTEMDIDAVLARKPAVALVDELAHTNGPGSRNERRWADIQELLNAGIDVISTLNIQHIESLNDIVEQITGVPHRETIPDEVLRDADQIEVIDLDPKALRDRLAGGLIYPAEQVTAAMSNYFRLDNLTALRELALLWLADEVDQTLQNYRAEHGIDSAWEARERVVVTLAGGPEGETLVRRGARIAARSGGGELLAVHVTSPGGRRAASPAALSQQRALVEKLGGTYHQVVGVDVPTTLVEFAKSVNATQLVIGVSRRSRIAAALTGPGIGATIIREAGNVDVHIVNHAAAGGGRFTLPRIGGALTIQRRAGGFGVALLGGPLLTWLLTALQTDESITSEVLSYQLLVVVVALVGGIWPALFAAVMSGISLDYFFITPFHTVTVSAPLHLLALVLYVVIGVLVSYVVDRAARQARVAHRAAAESELLATVAGSVLRGQGAVQALVDRTREAFGLAGVRLIDDGAVLAASGQPLPDGRFTQAPVGNRAVLELHGADLEVSERRLLTVVVAQLDAALEHSDLAETASEVGPLAASDRVRSALLSAVSHDLRRPLAAATAAVSGLRATRRSLSDADTAELLETADESLKTLAALVTDLLDASRLQAGVLAISPGPVEPADVILPALEELGLGPDSVQLELDPDGPPVTADAVLLQRVVVNLLSNASRHSPRGSRVRVTTSAFAGRVEIRIIDNGPGIPPERRDDVFLPFQRRGDTDNTTGLGLGLALSRGFVEGMGGVLTPEETPGGGITMVVSLPAIGAATMR